MRGLKNTGLTISGIVAIVFLLAASGLMLLTIGSGPPGTWTPLSGDAVKETTYGWPLATAFVKSTARGRYGSTGYYFDITDHSGYRGCGGVLTTTWMAIAMCRHINPTTVVMTVKNITNPNIWGCGYQFSGVFYSSQTQTKAQFKSLVHTFILDSGTAYVFP